MALEEYTEMYMVPTLYPVSDGMIFSIVPLHVYPELKLGRWMLIEA